MYLDEEKSGNQQKTLGNKAIAHESESALEEKFIFNLCCSRILGIYFGKSIVPVLNAMCNWGASYLTELGIELSI